MYHLTMIGRMHIGITLLLLCIPEIYDTIKQWTKQEVLGVYTQWLQILERSFITRDNRVFVFSVLRTMRMVMYAMLSMKLTSFEHLKNGTSTMSMISLCGIIFAIIVTIMESKPVEAVKMSPQQRAHKKTNKEGKREQWNHPKNKQNAVLYREKEMR